MRMVLAAAVAVVLAGSAHAQCVQEKEKPADYYVLGTLVHPQSNVLVAGDCDKSYDELEKAYIESDKADAHGSDYSTGRYYPSTSMHCEAHVTGSGGHSYLNSWCN